MTYKVWKSDGQVMVHDDKGGSITLSTPEARFLGKELVALEWRAPKPPRKPMNLSPEQRAAKAERMRKIARDYWASNPRNRVIA